MSLLQRLRPYCWLVLFLSLIIAAYSLLALAMAGSLSGTPNLLEREGEPVRRLLRRRG